MLERFDAKNKPPYHLLLTPDEAAKMLHASVKTVRRWSNSGLLTPYRIGPRRDRRFKIDEVKRLQKDLKENYQSTH
jgi:excisionase family DNA binding protein